MTITRFLTSLAVAATATAATFATFATVTSSAQAATTGTGASWGPYYAPGHLAKAAGTLTATGEDHAVLATADVVRVTGKVYDYTRSPATCGWAVFRIAYRKGNNLPNKLHAVRDCSYRTPKRFVIERRDVYQVEFKVCSEAKAAKPSLNCLYSGTWKSLYLSK
jgi:hypothetical protein